MTDRNELERLLAAATEGPWAVCTDATGDTFIASMTDSAETVCEMGAMDTGEGQAQLEADAALICFLRNNAQHYLSLMDEVEKLRRDRETLIEFAKSINSWRSDCDSYDRECSNPHRNYCEDVELMELSAGHALRRVNASQALGETHDR